MCISPAQDTLSIKGIWVLLRLPYRVVLLSWQRSDSKNVVFDPWNLWLHLQFQRWANHGWMSKNLWLGKEEIFGMWDFRCLKMRLFAWHCHLHVMFQEILLDSPACTEKRIFWILVEQQQSAALHKVSSCHFHFLLLWRRWEGRRRERKVFSDTSPIQIPNTKPGSRYN